MSKHLDLSVFHVRRELMGSGCTECLTFVQLLPKPLPIFRLALNTPVKSTNGLEWPGDKIPPLFGSFWHFPTVEVSLEEGTYIEIAKFNPKSQKHPFEITEFYPSSQLVEYSHEDTELVFALTEVSEFWPTAKWKITDLNSAGERVRVKGTYSTKF